MAAMPPRSIRHLRLCDLDDRRADNSALAPRYIRGYGFNYGRHATQVNTTFTIMWFVWQEGRQFCPSTQVLEDGFPLWPPYRPGKYDIYDYVIWNLDDRRSKNSALEFGYRVIEDGHKFHTSFFEDGRQFCPGMAAILPWHPGTSGMFIPDPGIRWWPPPSLPRHPGTRRCTLWL
jgi:hypothetical protein